jgi:hypothetical protein
MRQNASGNVRKDAGADCCGYGSTCCAGSCCDAGVECCDGHCCQFDNGPCDFCQEVCNDPPDCEDVDCVVRPSCDDGNPCTDDICSPDGCGDWECDFVRNTDPCADDGDSCTRDQCQGGECYPPRPTALSARSRTTGTSVPRRDARTACVRTRRGTRAATATTMGCHAPTIIVQAASACTNRAWVSRSRAALPPCAACAQTTARSTAVRSM